ncbi:MAG TPA: adenylate kinase [Gemmatimonadales bacterium]|nr:adenylate kinase [Gemmatimonadales bacterium]
MDVIILGAPGSGKGTQGKLLAQHLGIPQISTGDLIRAAMKDSTPLGVKAKVYYDQGLLVPDEIIFGLIDEILSSAAAAKGVLMDGFPRTIPQAEAVDRLLEPKRRRVDRVVVLDVEVEELVQRLLARASKEGRADDNPESIRQRLRVYEEQTAPLIGHYEKKGVVRKVMGMGSVDDIQARVREAVA